MEIDEDKIDEAVLGLLWLTLHDEHRAWKGMDWSALDRLHRKAAEILKAVGCWMLFLPAYSPDLNPIEMAFSKLKAHLRHIGARSYDALIQALGDICGLYDPEEGWNFFKAAGYASD